MSKAENVSVSQEPRRQIIEEINQGIAQLPYWKTRVVRAFVNGLQEDADN